MPHLRASILITGLLCGLCVSVACDRKWDFECTATWTDRKGIEISRKVYEYPQMDTEQAATERCKKAMLDAVPKGGKQAVCKCVGQE